MTTALVDEDPQLKRLQWRVRRGTRELDTLFSNWLERHNGPADQLQRQAFAQLLEVQDPDLWDWLIGHSQPIRTDWQAIIDDIRAHYQL